MVISSEMIANEPRLSGRTHDPSQAKVFADKVLHHPRSYAKEPRIVLCHATARSRMILSCAIDHRLETQCAVNWQTHYTEDAGQVVASIDAQPAGRSRLTKFMAYHTSRTASPDEMCARVERTLDRAVADGFPQLLQEQEQYMRDFWDGAMCRLPSIPRRQAIDYPSAASYPL